MPLHVGYARDRASETRSAATNLTTPLAVMEKGQPEIVVHRHIQAVALALHPPTSWAVTVHTTRDLRTPCNQCRKTLLPWASRSPKKPSSAKLHSRRPGCGLRLRECREGAQEAT